MNGWWKFHRKMLEHAVWSLPGDQVKVWLTFCSNVNIKEGEWFDGVNRVLIPAGTYITSQDHIAKDAKVGRQTVRTAIKNLIRLESISTKIVTNRYTMITVTNWPIYSGEESQPNQVVNQPLTNHQPTANQPLTTTEEVKKEKKERKRILLANPDGFAAFWSAYPRKVGKGQAEKAWNRIAPQNGLVETILSSILAHKRTEQWGDQSYIPYPATFLNGKRWEDELSAPHQTPQPTVVDLKAHWKTRDAYLIHLKAGRVGPKWRVPEWEQTSAQV